MKNFLLFLMLGLFLNISAQTIKNANVYPSNLEENMYFEKYDAASQTISGIYFMVLCDGDNSQNATPAFEVSLYLIPQGSTSKEDVIIIKKYPLKGIYHMGSHEFKAQKVSLAEIEGLEDKTYRLGIWVNSNSDFTEDDTDNAMLFKTPISIKKSVATKATLSSPAEEIKEDTEEESEETTDDGW